MVNTSELNNILQIYYKVDKLKGDPSVPFNRYVVHPTISLFCFCCGRTLSCKAHLTMSQNAVKRGLDW